MRTDRYRLVVWRDVRNNNTEPVFTELFDHKNDPKETINIAGEHPKLVNQLQKQLAAGWKQAL